MQMNVMAGAALVAALAGSAGAATGLAETREVQSAVTPGTTAAPAMLASCKRPFKAPVVKSASGLPFCASLSSNGSQLGKPCALRTGFDITREMGTGWNLGNSMDSLDGYPGARIDETRWSNPRTTRANIAALKALGMNTLRLPVSWDDHVKGPDWTIDKQWMDRVEEIANYALDNGMYVIINVHHNTGWEAPSAANEAHAKTILVKLWAQIAQRFKAYEHRVIFETMNEPRVGVSGKEDWVGKLEYYEVVNRLNAAALAAIRATGGNNARRLVMLPTYAAGGREEQLDAMVMPADRMIALSNHAYTPYEFALKITGTAVFDDQKEIDQLFDRLNRKFIQKGVPVVMGEWGSVNKNNLPERIRHAAYIVKGATRAGIPTIVWDNGIHAAAKESDEIMALFNRRTNTWVFPELMDAMMCSAQ